MGAAMSINSSVAGETMTEYVTVVLGGQLFGLPISRVQDVFMPQRVTRVPLAQPEIAGVLNLRGRIVTAIDMRCRLGLAPRDETRPPMAVGIECKGESYGLLIDSVGEVLKLDDNTREPNPSILTRDWREFPRAFTGWTNSSWSSSTSTGCWTRGMKRWRPQG